MTLMRAMLFAILMLPSLAFAGDWVEMYQQDGVTVSSKVVPGTKLIPFKGETVLNAPIDKVLYVLMDHEHRVEWVDRLYLNRILQEDGPYDYVIYQAFALPAIFSNRDYVYHGSVVRDAATGVIELSMGSVEHADAPETVGVRANLINSRYVLTPLDDGTTSIQVEIQTDPAGMMPTWLVNLIQKSWPLKTLNGVRGQLSKPYTGSFPLPGVSEEEPEVEEPEVEEAPAEESTPGLAEEPAEGGSDTNEAPTDDTSEE